MTIKRPSFQFYPGDHLHDTGLRACSLAARGLWVDMLCYMHQGTPYGHLTLPKAKDTGEDPGKDTLHPIHPPTLARMVGSSHEEVVSLLAELEENGVFSRNEEGVVYCRRMIKDEKLRELRASGGCESLRNPNVPRPKDRKKDTLRMSFGVSSQGSPSSSSSSSSSSTASSNSPLNQKSSSGQSVVPDDKSSQAPYSEAGERIARHLLKLIQRYCPDAKVPVSIQGWAVEADQMVRLDRRDEKEILSVMDWALADDFWRANVLRMDKIRDKYDQLNELRKTRKRSTALGNSNSRPRQHRGFDSVDYSAGLKEQADGSSRF